MRKHDNWRWVVKGRYARYSLAAILLILGVYGQVIKGTGSGSTNPADDVDRIGSCSLELVPGSADGAAIVALLNTEGAYVVEQDIAALMQLWTHKGRAIDAKHTPSDRVDDQTWQGIDAIRHRYLYRVFPGVPTLARPTDMVITILGEQAIVTGTTRIGNEISPQGDRWQLIKTEGCWVIQELVFNLEPP